MKVLLVLAHFYRAQEKSIYSSTDPRAREQRRRCLEEVLLDWRAHYGESATINIEHRKCEIASAGRFELDIRILTHGKDHLLDEALLAGYGAKPVSVELEDPRMLPFAAHRYMANQAGAYDWYVYSEDDLVLRDASFFDKQQWFRDTFGEMRLLQPNRYETNPRGTRFKTFVDGDVRKHLTDKYFEQVPGELQIQANWGSRCVTLARARNPHSGFFAINRRELAHWIAQPHFLDFDCSFVGPLESAASLAMLKTFPIYKASRDCQDFCEIHHMDRKYSGLRFEISESKSSSWVEPRSELRDPAAPQPIAPSERATTVSKSGAADWPRLEAFVISWGGKHENAAKIASQLRTGDVSLTVIYSDPDPDFAFPGEYRSIRRPDNLFWGDKFSACLSAFDADLMLVIHADAACEDWTKVTRRCRGAMKRWPEIGLWAPLIDWTPFDVKITAIGKLTESPLLVVTQTDSIVLCMAAAVVNRLRSADLSKNVYGHGIDQMAIAYCFCKELIAVVDTSVSVEHPKTRGYPTREATKQQRKFLKQLSTAERVQHALSFAYLWQRNRTVNHLGSGS